MTLLHSLPDAEAACASAAQHMAGAIDEARAARGAAHVVLAGGNTPRRAYELLAPMLDDWSDVSLWYGDERCVPGDDPDSNHHMVAGSLLAAIAAAPSSGTPTEHRVPTQLAPEEAATAYATLMRELVGAGQFGIPTVDVAILGLGEDGHTASLFPGRPELDEMNALCLAVHDAPKPPPDRVTLTVPVLRAARLCLILATGAGKAQPVAAVMRTRSNDVPASLLRSEQLHVICDEAAAAAATE